MVDDTINICRLYKQTLDTIIKTNANHHDLIQPYNSRNLGGKISPTLTTRPEGLKTAIFVTEKKEDIVKARRLTPRECYRLMGVDDCDIDVLLNTNIGDTKHWKLSGNSIVVDCLTHIFDNLFNKEINRKEIRLW